MSESSPCHSLSLWRVVLLASITFMSSVASSHASLSSCGHGYDNNGVCVCYDSEHYWSSERCSTYHEGPELLPGQFCSPNARNVYCSWMGVCSADGMSCLCDDYPHRYSSERCAHWHQEGETPTLHPTASPTLYPSLMAKSPTPFPTAYPSAGPSTLHSVLPTVPLTMTPTIGQNENPSICASPYPTLHTSSEVPTLTPSLWPISEPTNAVHSIYPTIHSSSENPSSVCKKSSVDVNNMITGEVQGNIWIEGGFSSVGDREWLTVSTVVDSFFDAVVFISLPDIAGDTSAEGYSVIARVRNIATMGRVSFDIRLFQANDSYCSRKWSTPVAIDPPISISWLVVERGAYNLTGKLFMIGVGNISRASSVAYDPVNRHQYFWPQGCNHTDSKCLFEEGVDVGVILQLQTTFNERLLIPRVWSVGRLQLKAILQPHDALDLSYYEIAVPEVLAYMSFENGIDINCVEKMSLETWRTDGVTNIKVDISFKHEYIVPPGLFGTIGSPASLGDSTGLRSFDLSRTGVSFITQEDQCVDEETEHTTGETVFTFVMGERANMSCVICKASFLPQTAAIHHFIPTIAPSQASYIPSHPSFCPSFGVTNGSINNRNYTHSHGDSQSLILNHLVILVGISSLVFVALMLCAYLGIKEKDGDSESESQTSCNCVRSFVGGASEMDSSHRSTTEHFEITDVESFKL